MKIRDAAGNFIGLKAQPLKLKEEEQGLLSVASSFTHVIDENSPLAGLNAKTLKQHVANISFIIQVRKHILLINARTLMECTPTHPLPP